MFLKSVICIIYSSASILSGEGRWRASYEQKGIVKVTGLLNGETIDGEKVLDAAIEAGAEDVQKGDDEDIVFYEVNHTWDIDIEWIQKLAFYQVFIYFI